MIREVRFQRSAVDRRSETNRRFTLAGVEVRDDEELGLADRADIREPRTATVRQKVPAAFAARTVRSIVRGSPAWKPQATFALEMKANRSASGAPG